MMIPLNITAIILTLNEELHLDRCLNSLLPLHCNIVIVDCFSSDSTLEIARSHGALILQNQWINYATQFNWALEQLDHLGAKTDWVLRIDADEFLTSELTQEILNNIPCIESNIEGVFFKRRMTFQGRLIRYGGVFPLDVLRLFRYGRGHCENRWMDEHIKITGPTRKLFGELIDDNLNSLTWWTEKHNKYASREAIDLLNLEFRFMLQDSVADLKGAGQVGVKRWLKENVYARLPTGFRAFLYFIYRYFIRLGFLDGEEGTAFHFLQGFWYRYLVDAKISETKRYMYKNNVDILVAIKRVLGVSI